MGISGGRDAGDDGVGRHVAGDDGPGGDHRPPTDAHPVGDNGPGTDPDIVLDDNALGSDALLDKGPRWVGKDVVHGGQLHQR